MLFAVILGGALSGKSGGNAGAFFGAFSGYNIIFTIGVYAVLYLITKYAVKNVLKPKQVPFESKKPEMVVASHEVHQTADDMMQDNA
jgi:thermostable 8-oxoguanine DNA glycosylase